MALAKEGYKGANQGTTKINVATNEDGQIAAPGEVATGVRTVSFNRVAAENSLTDNVDVIGFFMGLIGGRYDTRSNKMTVSWEASVIEG